MPTRAREPAGGRVIYGELRGLGRGGKRVVIAVWRRKFEGKRAGNWSDRWRSGAPSADSRATLCISHACFSQCQTALALAKCRPTSERDARARYGESCPARELAQRRRASQLKCEEFPNHMERIWGGGFKWPSGSGKGLRASLFERPTRARVALECQHPSWPRADGREARLGGVGSLAD